MREEKKTSLTDHSAWRAINEWAPALEGGIASAKVNVFVPELKKEQHINIRGLIKKHYKNKK
ncbi:MAG: hypothetical protein AAB657_05025 [Patescibacteria group bacterium]